ncbi:diguanylate cyclase [Silvibacterium dinghuense]|uniref:diguanylate cyclase n=1 Tax=Silvibacterium dinghuense TaxID=1560006 RepID=A0A4V1NVD8_9BACT|nr:diguanylate cyclase [Silvibacterium dinghuense]RXS95420.1 diguanylate cyclase [Silvibacterium dinghuense]GGH13082.1 hypothetical protein GCM10011586_32740 [Silvibacterium dinghuense]
MEAKQLTLMRDLVRLAFLLILADLAASLVNLASWHAGGVTVLWPTNALLAAYLLSSPRGWKHASACLALGFSIDLAENLVLGWHLESSFYLACCNLMEVVVAWLLIRRVTGSRPDLTNLRHLLAMLLYGVGLASAATAIAASFLTSPPSSTLATLVTVRNWYMPDMLGMATVLPLYLSYRLRTGLRLWSWTEAAGLFSLVIAATLFVFGQNRYPLLFLLTPVLLFVGVRMGLAGSAMALLLIAVIGGILTSRGHGPTMLIHGATIAQRDMALQAFIALTMLTLYILDVVVVSRLRLQQNLDVNETRFRMLAESSRDIIVLTDLAGNRQYVSPAALEVLGWSPEELIGGSYQELVHTEDIELFQRMLEDCREGRPMPPTTYRQRAKNGSYRWLESNPRLLLDPATGEATGYVAVVRDITDRKKVEEELARAFSLVETLASVDGLTGLANRRRFDEVLEQEWLRTVREGGQLSLLMLDVDHFKHYNDLYGHLSGDECLRQVAEAIQETLNRATDLAARYGGEEFAVILPNTGHTGALMVCNEILKAVRLRGVAHSANPPGVVTVSAGCASMSATVHGSWLALLRAADAALYQAKAQGRDQLQIAGDLETA